MVLKKTIAAIFTATLICCVAVPFPVAADEYIVTTESTKADLLKEYLSEMSLSKLAGKRTPDQIPYTILRNRQAAVTTVNLNIRKGCSTNETVLGTLNKGDKVTIIGAAHDCKWVYVTSEKYGRGFVCAKYLTITGVNKDEKKPYLVSVESADELSRLTQKGIVLEKADDDMLMFEALLAKRGVHLEKTIYENIEAKTMYVVTDTPAQQLCVREGCASSYKKIGLLNFGDAVTIKGYGINKKWAYVTAGNISGFVHTSYLSETRPKASNTVLENNTEAVDIENGSTAPDLLSEVGVQTAVYDTNYLGEFKITYYCNCSKCCGKWAGGATASGTSPVAGRTIAVDPSVIPLGSEVIIDGHLYTAEDTGSSIVGNRIDMYMDSHEAALDAGVTCADVYLVD